MSWRLAASVWWVTLAILLASGSSAADAASSGSSPWWHLSLGTNPARVEPGTATDEVQSLTVRANAGELFLYDEQIEEGRFVPFNAQPSVMQGALEVFYGKGNVVVKGGEGNSAGSDPYVIEFTGTLADLPQPIIGTAN
jgi:hypothetical protein